MTHEIDSSNNKTVEQEAFMPLIAFDSRQTNNNNDSAQNDPYGQYRGLQALSQVLNRLGSGNAPGDQVKIPDNVECVGNQCVPLTLADAAKEKEKIAASENRINLTDHSKIPDNVECVGNECRVLSPEELAQEKAKLASYPSIEITKNEPLGENEVCIGNDCRTLSPEEAAAEREKMQAAGNNFEVYMPKSGMPDNVICIGDECRILTAEEISAERAKMEAAKCAADCCVNCNIPENVKCIGNECVVLTPEQVAAEKAGLLAKGGGNVHIACACCNRPDNVVCVGNECRVLSPEELSAERAKVKGATKHICSCCNNCSGGNCPDGGCNISKNQSADSSTDSQSRGLTQDEIYGDKSRAEAAQKVIKKAPAVLRARA